MATRDEKAAEKAAEDKQAAVDEKARTTGVNEQVGAVTNPSPIAEADKSSYPTPNDAELDQPPLRSPRAPVDLAVSLAEGAGKHNPPDPEKYDAQGRPRS